jgi:hypothetical protein
LRFVFISDNNFYGYFNIKNKNFLLVKIIGNKNEDKSMNAQNDKNLKEEKEIVTEKTLRKMAVAGQFYPSDKKELEKIIDDYLNQAEEVKPAGKYLSILILPHAGYEFSGAIIAVGFKQIQNREINRIILLGRSHRDYFSDIVADTNDFWQTPLGDLEVDQEWIKKVGERYDFINQNEFVHRYEHSLEVMAPFIKKIFNDRAKIIPLLLGEDDRLNFNAVAQMLLDNIDNKTLLIVSTDLSHYPTYQKAKSVDQKTIVAILTGNLEKFQNEMEKLKILELGKNNLDTLACAESAVAVAEKLAEKIETKSVLFKYVNSGDIYPRMRGQVVGYAAIGFYSDKELPISDSKNSIDAVNSIRELNEKEKKIALEIARQSIRNYLVGTPYILPEAKGIFKSKRGVFVTLRKNKKLRGCIGNFESDKNLAENIKDMALAAAFKDPRFLSLQPDEIDDIKIEISVLSPMQKINNPEIIEVGKHGVYITKGINSGVFLPQVATEEGWTKEQFLDNLCEHKAGIDKNAWRDGSADLYIFTAQMFEEE